MYQEIYSVPNLFWLSIKVSFLILVSICFYIFISGFFRNKSKTNLFIALFFLVFAGIFGLGTYKSLLHTYFLKSKTTSIIEGKISQVARQDWNSDRTAKAFLEVNGIKFYYTMKYDFFYPSYTASFNEDTFLYKDREVRINYIVTDTTNYILMLEIKADNPPRSRSFPNE